MSCKNDNSLRYPFPALIYKVFLEGKAGQRLQRGRYPPVQLRQEFPSYRRFFLNFFASLKYPSTLVLSSKQSYLIAKKTAHLKTKDHFIVIRVP